MLKIINYILFRKVKLLRTDMVCILYISRNKNLEFLRSENCQIKIKNKITAINCKYSWYIYVLYILNKLYKLIFNFCDFEYSKEIIFLFKSLVNVQLILSFITYWIVFDYLLIIIKLKSFFSKWYFYSTYIAVLSIMKQRSKMLIQLIFKHFLNSSIINNLIHKWRCKRIKESRLFFHTNCVPIIFNDYMNYNT